MQTKKQTNIQTRNDLHNIFDIQNLPCVMLQLQEHDLYTNGDEVNVQFDIYQPQRLFNCWGEHVNGDWRSLPT